MERKIGKLGLSPIEAMEIGHSGNPGCGNGPEKFLEDKINLNVVYSVYETPRTKEEIAEELGMTPVFLEERIERLEENGFLVKTTGGKYTTYVKFSPKSVSVEEGEAILKKKAQVVEKLIEEYVPKVRAAIADFADVYVPSGNRELFEAAVLSYAISGKCAIQVKPRELEKYRIRPIGGGDYIAMVNLKVELTDPDYKPTLPEAYRDYSFCGEMTRSSEKYPQVYSWSVDSRFCSRKGHWENNLTSDYEYLYEIITNAISDVPANCEKFNRLKERGFLTEDGKINIMVVKTAWDKFVEMIPEPDTSVLEEVASFALEQAMQAAKMYPPQMQDLIVYTYAQNFIGHAEAMMVLDKLYENGTFHAMSEQDRVSAQLLMFCDALPQQ